ncbi:MAG: TolC family protein, partial [Planctomycetia bacterium]
RARLAVVEAGEALADTLEALAVLINEPPETTAQLVPRGSLRDTAAPPPPLDELTKIALACRADVRAVRVGVSRANAEVALQRANRFDDVFLFYDPITIQDFSPYNRQASHSWAAGITCSLPIFNRNQGNIARATSNVRQTREELTSVERRVVSEVRLAEREYQVSRRACEQIERAILPLARERVDRRARQLAEGTISLDDYQSSEEEVADVTTSLRDALLRHRRSMLDLNTAVGLRILP